MSANLENSAVVTRLEKVSFHSNANHFRNGSRWPWWLPQMAQQVKNLIPMQETQEMQVQSLGQEDPLEKEIATHSSMLAWEIPWTEETGESWGLKESGMTEWLSTHTHTHTHINTCTHTHTREPRKGMESEAEKVGREYMACYQASYHSGKPEHSGSLWEAAYNTDLCIAQLMGKRAGVFIYHLLPVTGWLRSWRVFFPWHFWAWLCRSQCAFKSQRQSSGKWMQRLFSERLPRWC